MNSRIITFEGKSLVSNAIGAFTGSSQSHVAWQTPDGKLWEAVDSGFKCSDPFTGDVFLRYHDKGTMLHFFEFEPSLSEEQEGRALAFLEKIKDQPYGFRTLFTFMLNPGEDPEKDSVICSEAVLGASIAAGRPLVVRMRPWNCSPKDIFGSPLLKWIGTARAGIDPYP